MRKNELRKLIENFMVGKILLIAYDLNPELGSECGVAHDYLRIYSKHFQVNVYTNKVHESDINTFNYGDNVCFNFIDLSNLYNILEKYRLYLISNWIFCTRILNELKNDDLDQYKFIHIVTPEGSYAFNNLYKLGIKYIIGPINGGLKTPRNFGKVFYKDTLFNFARNFIYKNVVKLPAWNKYYKGANTIIISDKNVLNVIPQKFHNKTYQIFDTLVDSTVFTPNLQRRFDQNFITLLFCGRLVPKKGILLLLEAIKMCVNDYKFENLILNIVGRGYLLDDLLEFIKKNKFENRIFVYSGLTRSSLIEKYQSADIFCLPTLREPGGLAILEAMSCGLPIITSNYGGPGFSVNSDCGIKIDLINYEQYVKDLTQAIIKLGNDILLRQKMGINARDRTLKEFSIISVEKKLLTVWGNLVNN